MPLPTFSLISMTTLSSGLSPVWFLRVMLAVPRSPLVVNLTLPLSTVILPDDTGAGGGGWL
jgi:hypothetical protein